MEKIIIIIVAIFILIESAVLLGPFLFKKKIRGYNETPRITQEYIQNDQIIIDESNLDNFDSRPLINRHLSEIQQEKNYPVYIVKNNSEEQLGYNTISQLNPDINPNKPVFIKPNLGGFISIKKGRDNGVINRTTSPIFVKGIIKYLKERGVQDITIGESWGVTDPKMVQELFQVSGYKELAEEMEIKLIDLNYYNDGNDANYPVKIKYPEGILLKDDIYISKTYLKYLTEGTVINVPKLKTHRFSITSLSLKNMLGVLMMRGDSSFLHANKSQMHKEINEWFLKDNVKNEEQIKKYVSSYQLFSERLSDLYVAVKPDFTIIEGYIGTEGDGFDKIGTRNEHIAFASENQIYADYIASSYMGFVGSSYLKDNFGFNNPLYLDEALQRFYKETDLDKNIKIVNPEGIQFNKEPFLLTPMLNI